MSSPTLLAQLPIDLFGPSQVEPLHQLDTLYYPLRDGLQMIVIDHIAYWDRKIYFLEQSQPRAIPHSAYLPMPFGNEYFFRDASGEIVKAYNSPYSLETLNAHFAKIPIDKENDSGRLLTHQDSINTKGVWAYSPNPMFYFRGFYKVFEPLADNPKQATFGLIDSMGKLVIPIQYQEIWPLGELLLVKRNDKWGVINRVNKIIVPLRYDEIDNYYADGLSDNIFFLKQGKFAAVFLPNESMRPNVACLG
ncbi:MAG: WG repeat-containing protein, partial [Bacteroidota bacterium]